MADPVETPIGRLTAEHFRPGQVRHRPVVGPKFLYALFNPSDDMHVVSRAFMEFVRDGDLPYRRLLLNEHIVDEAATRLKKQCSIQYATKFLTTLTNSQLYQLEYVPETVFETAATIFTEWTDLNASFTDFVVAEHMDELGVEHIVTYDRHYDAFEVVTLPYTANSI
jgi:predicted nucleic acid-binding protein